MQLKFTLGQAVPGKTYRFAARARSTAGWGPWTAAPLAFTVPAVPGGSSP